MSKNRWLITVATLDPRGWDSNHSIIYQLRDGGPSGPVIREGLLAGADHAWDPLQTGASLSKRLGMAVPFGIPKGAQIQGRKIPGENVFVVKWYRRPFLMRDGRCISASDKHNPGEWPEGADIHRQTFRMEWIQLRLNDAEDDVEVLQPARTMRQNGYETDEEFCSLGPHRQMNHSMVPPIWTRNTSTEWIEFDSFSPYPGASTSPATIAPVRFVFNERTGLYEWRETGPLLSFEDWRFGESSLIRMPGGNWIVGFRARREKAGYAQLWFRGEDPFGKLTQCRVTPMYPAPRHCYLCPDGALRIFANEEAGRWRDPLVSWDVDPETFTLSNRQLIADLNASGLPFTSPGADMCKLCPHASGSRQILLFRAITLKQTAEPCNDPSANFEEHAAAGVHYAGIEYDDQLPDEWDFVRDEASRRRPKGTP